MNKDQSLISLLIRVLGFCTILTFMACKIMISSVYAEQSHIPLLKNGQLDLRSWDFDSEGTIPLTGEWTFYWGEFVNPDDFMSGQPLPESVLIDLPRLWNDLDFHGEKLPAQGYATMHIKILLPPTKSLLGLKLMDFNTAARVFVDGKQLAQIGVPGKLEVETIPFLKPQVVELEPKNSEMDIVIHVSNFHDRIGGIRQPVVLGTASQVSDLRDQRLVFEFLLFGSIIIMALYHLGLYLLRRKGTSALYFSLFCFLIALRTVLTGERYLLYMFPDLDWQFAVKVEILSFYLAVPVFAMFIQTLFAWVFSLKFLRFVQVFSITISSVVLAIPIRYGTQTLPIYQLFTLVSIVYILYVIIASVVKKKEGAVVFAFGFSALILTTVNDILYDLKVIDTGFWVPVGVFIFIFSQAFLLSARFSKAFQRIELLSEELGEKSTELSKKNVELQHHKDTLEQKVIERTESVKVLLDNTGQGFLTFRPNYSIDSLYSKACQIFFSDPIEEKSILDILNPENQEDKGIKEMLDMVFEGNSSIDLFREILPKELIESDRILSCDYRLIPPAGTETQYRVMLILTDITRERQLAEQLKQDEARKEVIIKIAIDKVGFIEFVLEINGQFESLKQILSNGDPSEIDPNAVFRIVHTIKGGAGAYALKAVQELAHQIEEQLDDFRSGSKQIDHVALDDLRAGISDLEDSFHQTLDSFSDVISQEELKSKERLFQIPASKIDRLKAFLESVVPNDQAQNLDLKIDEICKQPIAPILNRYKRTAEELAIKLSKSVRVKISGAQTEISMAKFDQLFSALVHLVRNCVDHGIEGPDIRTMSDKSPEGKLNIDVIEEHGKLKIQISDDGNGIDTDRIKSIAISKGLINESEADGLTEDKALALIFSPGFSTAEVVSDVSGRGVGMDAVQTIVTEMGGDLAIQTKIGEGTTFTIEVPS